MGDNDLDGSSGDDKILYALIARGQTSLGAFFAFLLLFVVALSDPPPDF